MNEIIISEPEKIKILQLLRDVGSTPGTYLQIRVLKMGPATF